MIDQNKSAMHREAFARFARFLAYYLVTGLRLPVIVRDDAAYVVGTGVVGNKGPHADNDKEGDKA